MSLLQQLTPFVGLIIARTRPVSTWAKRRLRTSQCWQFLVCTRLITEPQPLSYSMRVFVLVRHYKSKPNPLR
jgi:hypothetical protein